MKNKKSMGRLKFIFLCIGVFVGTFMISAIIKVIYKPAELRKYNVEWSSEIGIIHRNLLYGKKTANQFDLYLPSNKTKKTYGLVVYLHAGGFTSGDKSDDMQMLQWLCSKGYVAAGINYTLRNDKNPGANVYSQSIEVKNSIPFIIKEAEKLGYHINEMAIAGGSAGGTLAMLYAYRDAAEFPVPVRMLFEAVGPPSFNPKDWTVYGLDKNKEAAAGLFSIMSGSKISTDMIGSKKFDEAIKPISAYMWITPKSVPTVCAYGKYDKVCPFNSVRHLTKALRQNNVPHEYIEFPHSGHALQNDDKQYILYMEQVEKYLDKYLPLK